MKGAVTFTVTIEPGAGIPASLITETEVELTLEAAFSHKVKRRGARARVSAVRHAS